MFADWNTIFFNCVILLALLKMLGENANELGFAQSYPQSW